MNEDFGFCSGVVFHLLGLDLPFVDGFQDGVDERGGVLRERYLADDERLVVKFLDLGAHLQHAATLTVVVFAHIDAAASGEVGIQVELFLPQITDGGLAQLHEVMWQNLRRQADSDAFGSLCQQQRELHGKGNRLLVPAVVGELPLGGLRIENGV